MKLKRPDIVVLGASAGGVQALRTIVSALPAGFDATVLVVLHVLADAPSFLPEILSRAGALAASHAADGELLHTGRIYVAPPDYHLLVADAHARLVRGPGENLHRPAIDPLFRSAAMAGGERVIGVLLTGSDDDGAAGLKAIQEHGGITIVQDPEDSEHPQMPEYALRIMQPDYKLPLARIGTAVRNLVNGMEEPVGRSALPQPEAAG